MGEEVRAGEQFSFPVSQKMVVPQYSFAHFVEFCVVADAPVLCCYVSHKIVSSSACSRRYGVATDFVW